MYWYRVNYTTANKLPLFNPHFRMYADSEDGAVAEFWERMTVQYGDGVKLINLISIKYGGECDPHQWKHELGWMD